MVSKRIKKENKFWDEMFKIAIEAFSFKKNFVLKIHKGTPNFKPKTIKYPLIFKSENE